MPHVAHPARVLVSAAISTCMLLTSKHKAERHMCCARQIILLIFLMVTFKPEMERGKGGGQEGMHAGAHSGSSHQAKAAVIPGRCRPMVHALDTEDGQKVGTRWAELTMAGAGAGPGVGAGLGNRPRPLLRLKVPPRTCTAASFAMVMGSSGQEAFWSVLMAQSSSPEELKQAGTTCVTYLEVLVLGVDSMY